MKTYSYPVETWSVAQCEKAAKKIHRDGLGTVGGPRGLIAHAGSSYPMYGQTIRYNGGTTIDDEWYEAVYRPLPKIPAGFHFANVVSWGTVIVKDS